MGPDLAVSFYALLSYSDHATHTNHADCIGLHLAKIELRLATGYFFRYFPNAKLSSKYDFNDNDMEQMLFFLMSPKGKRCLLEV